MSKISLDQARKLLAKEASEVSLLLRTSQIRIVLAESCTGGMVSAMLASISGASEVLCGSIVSYRLESKTNWLGISPLVLRKENAVSEAIAMEMAVRALEITPEAGLAASITGHLGPDAPKGQDGLIYTGLALRTDAEEELAVFSSENRLSVPQGLSPEDTRAWRQLAASHSLLMVVRSLLTEEENVKTDEGEKKNGSQHKNKPRQRIKKQRPQ